MTIHPLSNLLCLNLRPFGEYSQITSVGPFSLPLDLIHLLPFMSKVLHFSSLSTNLTVHFFSLSSSYCEPKDPTHWIISHDSSSRCRLFLFRTPSSTTYDKVVQRSNPLSKSLHFNGQVSLTFTVSILRLGPHWCLKEWRTRNGVEEGASPTLIRGSWSLSVWRLWWRLHPLHERTVNLNWPLITFSHKGVRINNNNCKTGTTGCDGRRPRSFLRNPMWTVTPYKYKKVFLRHTPSYRTYHVAFLGPDVTLLDPRLLHLYLTWLLLSTHP